MYRCIVVSLPVLLDKIDSSPCSFNSLTATNLNRHHQQSEFNTTTRRIHRRSQQRDQITIVDGLASKGPVNENFHTDIKHRVRSRRAPELPADNLAHRLEHLVWLEDGVPVEEPVVVRGETERLALSSVPIHERAVGGQVESGDVNKRRQGQFFDEDHDLEIAGAASSGTVDDEIVAVEVGARPRCNEVEVG